MSYAAPLSSPVLFAPAISGINSATRNITNSVARLSSGNRLNNAGDDVAALVVSSILKSQISSLKVAQTNTSQGTSFLQVAYDGLSQVRDMLDRMTALAVQASSGSLTDLDRQLYQAEFSGLSDEIDRIANNTKFGRITLLDGSASGQNRVTTNTGGATQASASLSFTGTTGTGDTVVINGVTLTADTDFAVGGSEAITVSNLATALTNSTDRRLSQATYEADGTLLTITAKAGGTLGNQFVIDQATSTATFTVPDGGATAAADVYTLAGGANDGLAQGGVTGSGTIGNSLVNTQAQVAASVTLTITGAISNGEQLRIDNGNGSTVNFNFATVASTSTDIQIGADTEETLQNAVKTISQYTGSGDYGVRQLDVKRSGSQLILTAKTSGNPTDLAAANLDITETLTNGTLSAATFSNGSNTGVNTSGVVNSSFTGTISGFAATYVGADSLTASVTVGGKTYTSAITDTTPASATFARFSSTSGGYFDVEIAAAGAAVSNQATADTFAQRLNAAFAPLTFTQTRNISSFTGTGGLAGGSAQLRSDDFTTATIRGITVTAPSTPGGDATIDVKISIDGTEETFRANSGIGEGFGAFETFTLTSLTNGNRTLKITNGATINDLSDADAALTFQSTLRDSFGLNGDGVGLDFQVGEKSSDKINVVIGDARTSTLFSDGTPSVDTQNNAEDAQDIIDAALDIVSEAMANVGVLQQRFDSASTNLSRLRGNIEQANSVLADTDIAAESTALASEILRANVATAVLAQATRLQSSLLDALKVV